MEEEDLIENIDSDTEGYLSMKGNKISQKKIINQKEKLISKFDNLLSSFKNRIQAEYQKNNGKPIAKIRWIERLDVSNPKTFVLQPESGIDPAIQQEVYIQNVAKEGAISGLKKLKDNYTALQRPDDYFADMYKDDSHMNKIKKNIENQANRLQRIEEKKLRVQNKKFSKQMQHFKNIEKSKEKRQNMEAINKWKKEIKEKGENAKDLSSFTMNKKGHEKRNQKTWERFANQKNNGKKKIHKNTKRPGKNARMKNHSKRPKHQLVTLEYVC